MSCVQVYYSLWRKLLKVFWWLVVAYTMLILISIYTYQFEDFPGYWRNLTGFTEEQWVDLFLSPHRSFNHSNTLFIAYQNKCTFMLLMWLINTSKRFRLRTNKEYSQNLTTEKVRRKGLTNGPQ